MNTESNEKNKLMFKDFIKQKNHLDKDWVTIATYTINKHESLFTKSVLVNLFRIFKPLKKMEENHIEVRFSKGDDRNYVLFKATKKEVIEVIFSDCYVNNRICNHDNLGCPSETGDILFPIDFEDYIIASDGLEYRPFVHFRHSELFEDTIDLDQKFILYYSLFKNKNSYICVNEDGDEEEVGKIEILNDGIRIKIRTNYLRDYLTISGYGLLRYHSHQRYVDIKTETKDIEFKSFKEKYRYRLWYGEDKFSSQYKKKNSSILRGIDIVSPYGENYLPFFSYKRDKKCVKFIIGIDEQGKEVERSCDCQNQPKIHLTFVYFNQKVLLKYYNEPKKYRIQNNHISCLDLWGIDYCIVEDMVHVYLGDLSRLPNNEQLYWRSHNIASSKPLITKDRFDRDFLAKLSEPEDLIYNLKKEYKDVNKIFGIHFKQDLFKELPVDELYNFNILRIPITKDVKEFNEIITGLSKVFVESLNVKLIWKFINQKADGRRSIVALNELLKFILTEEETITKITKPFYIIWDIRSSSAGHIRGKKFSRKLKEYGIDDKDNIELIEFLINLIIESLRLINIHLTKIKLDKKIAPILQKKQILLSIKPKYVKKIFDGTKQFLFRKVVFKNKNITKIFIYSTNPEKKIVGSFKVGKIIKENPKELWKLFGSKGSMNKDDFFIYFNGKNEGFAIEIRDFDEFSEKIDPYKKIPGFKPPHTFSYFDQSLI